MLQAASFVHLRVHSAYSLLEGALRIPALVDLCVRHGMPAVAVTDTNNLFGALEFAEAARAKGVQPIIGAQVSLARPEDDGPRRAGAAAGTDTIVLLAQTPAGWGNLMALMSEAWLAAEAAGPKPIAPDALKVRAEGLICLTGGVAGPLGRCLLEGRPEAAADALQSLQETFGDRLYVEVQRHGLEDEAATEPGMVDLAHARGVPLVATNGCLFAGRDMHGAHDALLCIAEGAYVSETDRRRVTPEHGFKSAAEMRALFADLPEAVDNTLVIARRCHVMPSPRPPLLPDYPGRGERSAADALAEMAGDGLERRLEEDVLPRSGHAADSAEWTDLAGRYRERLAYELGVIADMGFPGYFLIVADFIQWAKGAGIPVGPGRGSGAGSVVAWALTITDLDPLRFGLLFERFLNPDRVSMPDFDVDFCPERRDDVIAYVQETYGADRVAQIITFGTLQARAVLRDVGRVIQMPYGQVDRIAKMVPNNPANPVTLTQAVRSEPMLRAAREEDPAVAGLIETATQLEGLYRHASTHAAGVVIADRPLTELLPLYRDARSTMPVTQFSMKWAEAAGLVKFDFLGLKTLTVLSRAQEMINARPDRAGRPPLLLNRIPLDDQAAYAIFSGAETTGVFQMESAGMRAVLRDLRPDRFEDIIAAVALYRPGPMENIPAYIARKHGREPVRYLHPLLEPVLSETYGIPVYQEQVMEMARVLAGYALGQADLLRRAMGKKKKDEMAVQRETFVAGAREKNGIDVGLANAIFDEMDAFAGYGFNKSHAAAYALIAYQTAWLKANFPVEFMAASMTMDMHSTDRLSLFRAEAAKMGIPLLPPDVSASGEAFTVADAPSGDGLAIRYALAALRNVGRAAAEAVAVERASGGPFADPHDFVERVPHAVLSKRMLETLAAAGAFDSLTPNRRRAHAAAGLLARHGALVQQDRESDQVNLFGGGPDAGGGVARPPLPDEPDWSPGERLASEFEALGFHLSGHPLDAYATLCGRLGVVGAERALAGDMVRTQGLKMAGIITGRRMNRTARGKRMAFVTLSDTTGFYEVTLFEEVLNRAWDMLDAGEPLLLTVDVQRGEGAQSNGAARLTATAVQPLAEVGLRPDSGLRILVREAEPLRPLAEALRKSARPGRGRLCLALQHQLPAREIVLELPQSCAVDTALRQAVRAVPGVVDAVID